MPNNYVPLSGQTLNLGGVIVPAAGLAGAGGENAVLERFVNARYVSDNDTAISVAPAPLTVVEDVALANQVVGVMAGAAPTGATGTGLPAGVTLNVSGQDVRVGGTPTTPGVSDPVITVTTADGPVEFTTTMTITATP